jgi:endonuclease/exonuclease/phosphatase (EEP) superfamily protein YafD
LAKGAWGLLLLVTAAAGLATLGAFFGRAWWIFDLFSNLHPQYCVVLAVAGLIFVLRRRWWLSLPAWLFAAINLALLLPYYVGAPAAQASGPTMRLLLSNVYSFRPDLDEVMVLVETADPDVVVLLEMIPAHWQQVQALATEYPYLFNEPLIRPSLAGFRWRNCSRSSFSTAAGLTCCYACSGRSGR